MKFIKDSIREIKHVVWPTKKESINYFFIVNGILIFFGLYLFIFSTIFSEGLYALKNFVSPTKTDVIIDNQPKIEFSTGNISETNTGNTSETGTSKVSTGNISN